MEIKPVSILSLETYGLKLLGLSMVCQKQDGVPFGIMTRLYNLDYTRKVLDPIIRDHSFIYVSDVGLGKMLNEDWETGHGYTTYKSLDDSAIALPKMYRAMSSGSVSVDSEALSRTLSESVLKYQSDGTANSHMKALSSLAYGFYSESWCEGQTFRSGKRDTSYRRLCDS